MQIQTPRSRVAVLLNRNAKRVGDDVVRRLGDAPADVFVSGDLEEAHAIARRVVAERYDTIVVGGGDGTFVEWASDILRLAEQSGQPAPRFGVLPLGTGNALATALGVSESAPRALDEQIRRAEATAGRPLPLLDVENRLSPFCGFGLDALILEDHQAVVNALRSLRVPLGAGAGYLLSVVFRSIPRFVISELPEITVLNAGEPALALAEDGEVLGEIRRGDVLYSGRAALASCATIPFVGFKLRLFPFADRFPGRMTVRVADVSTAEVLPHLAEVWRGEFRSPGIHDFVCTAVEMQVDRPSPFQVGGDLVGRREHVSVAMARRQVRVVA